MLAQLVKKLVYYHKVKSLFITIMKTLLMELVYHIGHTLICEFTLFTRVGDRTPNNLLKG